MFRLRLREFSLVLAWVVEVVMLPSCQARFAS